MASVTNDKVAAKIVPHEDWVTARKELLKKEKEFTRLRDELSRQRRELPWEKVEKQYVFEGPQGELTLADLFEGRSQLIVYHFMLGPGWKEGCPSCSFLADSFDPARVHLAHRDATLVVVSRATLPEIEAFKKRMGWRFKWVSSNATDFNFDYQVSATKNEEGKSEVYYNYQFMKFPAEERPGLSVFYKDAEGDIFHTYSTYARGLDILIPTYNFLDMTPKGRDEDELPHSMAWVRHHDRYDDAERTTTLSGPLLAEFLQEAATTRRVLERIPADKLTWKPHPKSMSLGQLAIHIASIPGRLGYVLTQHDRLEVNPDGFEPAAPKDLKEVHETFEQGCKDAEAYLKGMSDEAANSDWTLMMGGNALFTRPRAAVLRSIMLNHWYHHRGQLSVYLRMLEVPVPIIYGRSADENPFG